MNWAASWPRILCMASSVASLIRRAPREPPKTNTVGMPSVRPKRASAERRSPERIWRRTGSPESFRRSFRANQPRDSLKARWTSSAIRARRRLVRPGTEFCSWRTTGRRDSHAATTTGAET
jgi:hypothetical protein